MRHKPLSVLCTLICRHDDVAAILFLDDPSANVFTSEGLTMLNVPLAQAAISLDNSDLFEKQTYAEENMRRPLTYLANTIDSMPSVLIGVDAAGAWTPWNDEAERMEGISAEEAVGRSMVEAMPSLGGEMDRVREAVGTGEVWRIPGRCEKRTAKLDSRMSRIYPLS